MERDAGLPLEGPVPAPTADAVAPSDVAPPDAGPPVAVAPARPPDVTDAIGRALDLALASSRTIRRASLYVGLVTLALIGPAVIVFLALVRDQGGLDQTMLLLLGEQRFVASWVSQAISWLGVSAFIAFIGLFAITLEGQILAATIVGGAAVGRTIGVREALRLSRRVFWSVVGAAILVGIVDRIVSFAASELTYGITASVDTSTVASILLAGLATMPFAYYQSGIVLGGVGAIESLRRSTRLARARWRLALLVALAGTVLSVIEVFALGAGLDLVVRVASAAGLGFDGSPAVAIVTGTLVLACVVAIGSLLVTIAALVASPQVYIFLKLTGYSAGLDRARLPTDGTERLPRLITRPMAVLIGLGALAGLAGVLSF
ncbi:MAG TPA: hypothetical protein VFO05_01195 [Candidatus Limnocylindrales bacterium]|nr:hypothetical protein [Candidatus Limnocylindrales bacterium]